MFGLCLFSVPSITSLSMVSMLVNGTLTSVSNGTSGLLMMSTEGGEIIRVTGSNFGPAFPRSYVSYVRYGLSYSMSNCTFVTAHSVIECVTVPGTGSGYRMQVRARDDRRRMAVLRCVLRFVLVTLCDVAVTMVMMVGVLCQLSVMEQSSADSSTLIGYAPPTLTSISPTSIPTAGGSFVLSGNNLGSSSGSLSVVVVGSTAFSNFAVRDCVVVVV